MISLIKKKVSTLRTSPRSTSRSGLEFQSSTRHSFLSAWLAVQHFSVGEINGVFSDFPQSIIDELLDGRSFYTLTEENK